MAIDRRDLGALGLSAVGLGALGLDALSPARARADAAAGAAPAQGATPAPVKVLRLALAGSESGFDPARTADIYSQAVAAHVFESLFTYDPLARPVRVVPLTAAAMPEHSADYRDWIITLRPGIVFTDHPAFKGKPRELTAADYVYSIKRLFDPALPIPFTLFPLVPLRGIALLQQQAREQQRGLDYDRGVEGLRALDRYTLQIRLEAPRPRLPELLTGTAFAAIARELVQAHGLEVASHPVGTGPYKLTQWRRGSLMVLERNALYRERLFEATPAPDDPQAQSILARLGGRRLPMIDRIELRVIEEDQPRWVAFLNGDIDVTELPGGFAQMAAPKGKLAAFLQRKGVQLHRELAPSVRMLTFNNQHPLVGGNAPDKVSLRRAIALAMDCERYSEVVYGGQAPPTHSVIAAQQYGYDGTLRSEMGEYDPIRARALLDTFGYADRDGDGWREKPDGSALLLEFPLRPDQTSRLFAKLFERDMRAIGVRVTFDVVPFSEQLKLARAGRLMMLMVGQDLARDSAQSLSRFYSKLPTGFARFKLAAMDELYERQGVLPDGPERLALVREIERLAIAYMPVKFMANRYELRLSRPHVVGMRIWPFRQDWFHLVDLEDSVARPG